MIIKKPIAKLSASETRLGVEAKKRKQLKFKRVRVIFKESKYNFSTSTIVRSKLTTNETIKKRFVGKMFNVSIDRDPLMKKCISIRFLSEK